MKCLVEFLEDNKQEEIRNRAQLQSDTHEEALGNYRDSFLAEINIIKSWPCNNESKKVINNNSNEVEIESKKKLLSLCNQECKDIHVSEFVYKVYDVIKNIEYNEIRNFFNTIIDTYIDWIDGNGYVSIDKLSKLLKEKNILDFKVDISNQIFFRARESKGMLSPWDMFHIPFNKRYLISNQRYSLTGQPLLYLGLSVLDVMSELNKDEQNFHNVKISTFDFKEKFEVYDLTNPFYRYLKGSDLYFMEMIGNEIDEKIIRKEFFKFILSNICKFKKRSSELHHTFYEEYVIPQILAQIIKQEGMNGIMYSSTKLRDNDNNYNSTYKDNVAIFTNFNRSKDEKHVYDKPLFENINISRPFNYEEIKSIEINADDIEYISNMLQILDKDHKLYCKYYNIALGLKNDFQNLNIEGLEESVKYLDHPFGKFHLYLIYSLILQKRNDCIVGGEDYDRDKT